MQQPTLMNLKVLLPFRIFAEKARVSRVVVETRDGSFGLLPHRLDCVAGLAPGILIYETEAMKGCWSRRAKTYSSPCVMPSAERT
jgi:alternate F1F0 ATPase F1 subunit epsilon